MRALAFLLAVVIVLVVAYLAYAGVRAVTRGRTYSLPAGGRWQARHFAEDGHTVVATSRMMPTGEVIEEHVVARIPDSDEDWSRKFLQAKAEAEERAFHLNTDTQS